MRKVFRGFKFNQILLRWTFKKIIDKENALTHMLHYHRGNDRPRPLYVFKLFIVSIEMKNNATFAVGETFSLILT